MAHALEALCMRREAQQLETSHNRPLYLAPELLTVHEAVALIRGPMLHTIERDASNSGYVYFL